jgi:hypothetical protein
MIKGNLYRVFDHGVAAPRLTTSRLLNPMITNQTATLSPLFAAFNNP